MKKERQTGKAGKEEDSQEGSGRKRSRQGRQERKTGRQGRQGTKEMQAWKDEEKGETGTGKATEEREASSEDMRRRRGKQEK